MFDGDFSLLPFRAATDSGPVPEWPTDEHFQRASMRAMDADPFTWGGAAAVWQLEAIRERRHHPGVPLDDSTLRTIALRDLSRSG